MTEYEAVIGLEVHAELKTNSKIFCFCTTEFGGKPNTHVCPICLGLPGTLPVLNEKVVDLAIKAGLALNCEIAEFSKFDRRLLLSRPPKELSNIPVRSAYSQGRIFKHRC